MKDKKKYKLAPSKAWMEKESSNFTASFLKVPQGVSIYQLKTGKAVLDVVPYVAGAGNPVADEGMLYWERTFFVHRNVGPNQSTYICPARTSNKRCPVCEARMKIMKSDPDNDVDFKAAKDMNAKEWQLVQLRDRNAKDKGIQLLPLSYYRFGEALKDAATAGDESDHWEHFWHPTGGKALRVQWAEDSMGSQKFIRAKTVLFQDRQDLPDSVIDSGHCLDDLLVILDYKKLKSIFETGTEDEDDEEDDDAESEGGDDDEGDTDEEEEEEKPKKKKPSKKDDDEEEEGEDDESDEDDPDDDQPDDEDDGDGEDEGDEDEPDEEEEKPVKKKKPSKKKDAEEEDDPDDESEGDDESDESDDEGNEDEEEEKPAKKKRQFGDGKTRVKTKDQEDEEEEEKPAKKGKGKAEPSDWDDFDEGAEKPKPKKKK